MTNRDETRVEVRQRLAVAPQKVFAAFAEARLVSRWLTPSPDISLTVLHTLCVRCLPLRPDIWARDLRHDCRRPSPRNNWLKQSAFTNAPRAIGS
jgi:hypothetical protein